MIKNVDKRRNVWLVHLYNICKMMYSESVVTVIDSYLSVLNAEWLRYGELAYQYGMEDILAMIKE